LNKTIRIGIAQINPVLSDIEYNVAKIEDYIQQASKQRVELLIFPELAIAGYLPMDLLLKPDFINANLAGLKRLVKSVSQDMIVLVGFADRIQNKVYNSVAIIQGGEIIDKRYKTLLPNYDVFDERRYFEPAAANSPVPVEVEGKKFLLGIEICEDLWDAGSDIKITEQLANQGANLIVNLSASPFEHNKRDVRRQLILNKIEKIKIPFVLVNQVGGQDQYVFDGNSLALDATGPVVAWGKEFVETLTTFELNLETGKAAPLDLPIIPREESIFQGLVLGVRDYFRKTDCAKAVIGLSGGIDSAVVACIAAEALGPENVTCVAMPGEYTARMSITDAEQLAKNLGVNFLNLPITKIARAYYRQLHKVFKAKSFDITEENIQSRIRGNILMAIANKFGYYVLSTGNKTELALGYCTLYGDMAGALAVISDLSKSDVYALGRWINSKQNQKNIPERIFTRLPSAELAEGQVDPFDYEVVSPLVDLIINEHKTSKELVEMGFDPVLVKDIIKKIRLAEFKRRQAAPGLKVTSKAFGLGRRFPIINHYKE
jgi:NAD+ synthase (glutamine-hydrolysing)